jgi:flavin reductase (DIM6/NTAB) family NADH-FMN oxidoreductase RutF
MRASHTGYCALVNDVVKMFLTLTGALDYPVFIVTAASGERREGCVMGFATQSSFDPPRFLACLSRVNRTFRLAQEADALAVHAVPSDRLDLAELFGGETGDDVDKFSRCEWRAGPRGLPIIEGCPSWFAGEVLERIDLGDHVGFLLDPFDGAHDPAREILFLQRVKYIDPGHPPT